MVQLAQGPAALPLPLVQVIATPGMSHVDGIPTQIQSSAHREIVLLAMRLRHDRRDP